MKLSKIILPLLVTSFCFGLNACTDDSKSTMPVVGDSYIYIGAYNFNNYFNAELKKEYDSDDSTNEYKYKIVVAPKSKRVKVMNGVITASFNVKFLYKLVANTNAAYMLTQSVDISIYSGSTMAISSIQTATFDKPINEYPWFQASCSVLDASGSILLTND